MSSTSETTAPCVAHNATATLIGWDAANVSVPDADVAFGDVAVGATVKGADTFVIRIDRSVFVDEIETEWRVTCDEKERQQTLTILLSPADVSGDDCVNVRDLLFIRAKLGLTGSRIVTPEADTFLRGTFQTFPKHTRLLTRGARCVG